MKLRRRGALPLIRNRIGPILFAFDDSLGLYIRMMRTGEFEFETVAAMRCILRRGDVFVDIGANLGYLSAWGMRLVSPTGRVHAFEPTVAMAERLDALSRMNPEYSLVIHRVAAGNTQGKSEVVLAGDAMQGSTTLVHALVPEDEALGREVVDIVRLDKFADIAEPEGVALVKIDVEGYEFNVLKGMEGWFRQGFSAPIICELTPSAYLAQGFALGEIIDYLAAWDYRPCRLKDFTPIPVQQLPRLGRVFNIIFMKGASAA